MAVKRTRFLGIRVTDGEYQQLLERCNGRQLAVLDTRCGCRPSIRFCCASLPGWGTTSTRSPGKLTAASGQALTGFRWWPR